MIKNILCISGKPGLFKLVSQGKNMLIVESLTTKKRTPAYSHDKIVSLGDIAIYTDEEEVPLSQVFQTVTIKRARNWKWQIIKLTLLWRNSLRKFFQIMTANVCIIQTSRKLYLGITR